MSLLFLANALFLAHPIQFIFFIKRSPAYFFLNLGTDLLENKNRDKSHRDKKKCRKKIHIYIYIYIHFIPSSLWNLSSMSGLRFIRQFSESLIDGIEFFAFEFCQQLQIALDFIAIGCSIPWKRFRVISFFILIGRSVVSIVKDYGAFEFRVSCVQKSTIIMEISNISITIIACLMFIH